MCAQVNDVGVRVLYSSWVLCFDFANVIKQSQHTFATKYWCVDYFLIRTQNKKPQH